MSNINAINSDPADIRRAEALEHEEETRLAEEERRLEAFIESRTSMMDDILDEQWDKW